MKKKALCRTLFLQLTFTQEGIKSIKFLEGKFTLTDVTALRANVCVKYTVSEPFMDLKINAFNGELMPCDYL